MLTLRVTREIDYYVVHFCNRDINISLDRSKQNDADIEYKTLALLIYTVLPTSIVGQKIEINITYSECRVESATKARRFHLNESRELSLICTVLTEYATRIRLNPPSYTEYKSNIIIEPKCVPIRFNKASFSIKTITPGYVGIIVDGVFYRIPSKTVSLLYSNSKFAFEEGSMQLFQIVYNTPDNDYYLVLPAGFCMTAGIGNFEQVIKLEKVLG